MLTHYSLEELKSITILCKTRCDNEECESTDCTCDPCECTMEDPCDCCDH